MTVLFGNVNWKFLSSGSVRLRKVDRISGGKKIKLIYPRKKEKKDGHRESLSNCSVSGHKVCNLDLSVPVHVIP